MSLEIVINNLSNRLDDILDKCHVLDRDKIDITYYRVPFQNNLQMLTIFESIEEMALDNKRAPVLINSLRKRVTNCQFFIAVSDNNEIVGYSAYSLEGGNNDLLKNTPFEGKPSAYLAGGFVSSKLHGRGVFRKLNMLRMEELIAKRTAFIYTRTQNPKTENAIISAFKSLRKRFLVNDFALVLRKKMPGTYQMQLAKDKPVSYSKHLQEHYDVLDYSNGDAYLFVYEMIYTNTH